MVTVVLGCQWGDEGKGKIVDVLAGETDIIVRFQGGANAGHTVVVGGQQYILHLIPSGILSPKSICVIGHGVVIDPKALLDEIALLKKLGIEVKGRLLISNRAHLVMPYHKSLDQAREKTASKIGTTGRGIGPAYTDKVTRSGIRMVDLLKPDQLRKKMEYNVIGVNKILSSIYETTTLEADEMVAEYLNYAHELQEYIADTGAYLVQAIKENKKILLEGAQGSLLDVDLGTYPYVTSSNTTAGGACTGSGIGPTHIDKVLGVVKAYTTRVGDGPFPAELTGPEGDSLREQGKEYGATTGRPRRCGWFDAVVVRFATDVSGVGELVITKLDVLDNVKEIKICTGYEYESNVLKEFPADLDILSDVKPVYETMPGWNQSTVSAKTFNDLPEAAQKYLNRLEELVGVPIGMVSVGPDRAQTIRK